MADGLLAGVAYVDIYPRFAPGFGQKVGQEWKQVEGSLGVSGGQSIEKKLEGANRQAVSLGRTLAGLGVGYKLGQVFGSAIRGASDLNEQVTKGQQVFGAYAAEVDRFAQGASKIGQSRRQALEATGTFGNLFTALGIGSKSAADMSIRLDKLASDLASFNNTSPDEALQALRSGLVGEVEPLRRYGVNLNEVTLKQKALELGLSDGKSVLDANAKAQAAYALILEQTGKAQGDFERTSGGLANKQRILAAEYENAKDRLGSELLPVMSNAVGAGSALLDVFSKIPAPVQAGVLAFTGLTATVGLLGPKLMEGASLLSSFGARALKAGQDLIIPRSAINGLGSEAQNTAGKVGLFNRELSEVGTGTKVVAGLTAGIAAFEGTTQALNALADAQTGVQGGPNLVAGLELLGKTGEKNEETAASIDRIAEAVKKLQKSTVGKLVDLKLPQASQREITNFNNALVDLIEQGKVDEAKKAFGEVSLALFNEGVTSQQVARRFGLYFDALDRVDIKNKVSAASVDKTTNSLLNNGAALKTATDKATQRWQAEMNEDAAARALADARSELADAQKAAAQASDGVRDAVKAEEQAERSLADAKRSSREAEQALTDARRDAAEQLEDLRLQAEGANLSEERAKDRLAQARRDAQNAKDDPRTTADEARDAVLSLAEADLALRQAQESRGDVQQQLADAERKGIEGSDQVVAAKQRVADASRAEQDAQAGVADAHRNVAKAAEDAAVQQVEAQARVQKATEQVQQATIDEATAKAQVAIANGGVAAGNDVLIAKLTQLRDTLDPNSPLRQHLNGYIADLERLNSAYRGETTAPVGAVPPTRAQSDNPGYTGPGARRGLLSEEDVKAITEAVRQGAKDGSARSPRVVKVTGETDIERLGRRLVGI